MVPATAANETASLDDEAGVSRCVVAIGHRSLPPVWRSRVAPPAAPNCHLQASGCEQGNGGEKHEDRRGPAEPAGERPIDVLAHDRAV